MNRYFKVEGNILYPDKTMLTWGPFYYHSFNNATSRIDSILNGITSWCNLKDPSLDIKPQNIIRASRNRQIVFCIKAWKNEDTLEECDGIIRVDDIFFKDEE